MLHLGMVICLRDDLNIRDGMQTNLLNVNIVSLRDSSIFSF